MKNERIMIIGGTGALGKTLTRQYAQDNDILIFSRDEHKHVNMGREFPSVEFLIGDVKDVRGMTRAINLFKPTIVINTAALKHVPICESNPQESVTVNIQGHTNLLEALDLSNHKISKLVFVSTDKACKPINVYGMCKAISEKVYLDFAKKQDSIRVVICRYGNVLESTGSVIPLIKERLQREDNTFNLTHPEMTRFLISLSDSVKLIDWAISNCNETHGCIVVPKLPSASIKTLIDVISNNLGSNSLKIVTTGIRPGEKLHEEMVSFEESLRSYCDGDYVIITENARKDNADPLSSESPLMSEEELADFLTQRGVF
jgi:UDP-N-acetylglucosamine 4,6-dehydratase